MVNALIPDDFPRAAGEGAVPGAHPKLLARAKPGRFVPSVASESDLRRRYESCEELVQQLVQYTARKRLERPDWTDAELRDKVEAALRRRAFGWGLSPRETEWILRRLAAF